MSIKGTVDPFRFGGRANSTVGGWYCMDDDGKRIDGPYQSREDCQAACDRINAENGR